MAQILRNHNQRVDRFEELQRMGWISYEHGKKPFLSYSLEHETGNQVFKSNTLNGLLNKVEHLQPEPVKQPLEELIAE